MSPTLGGRNEEPQQASGGTMTNCSHQQQRASSLKGASTPLPVANVPKYGSCQVESAEGGARRAPADEKSDESDWLQRAARRVPCLGIIFSLCASLFLGSAGMLVKMTQSVHGIQVAVFRALIQLAVYGLVIGWRRLPWTPARAEFLPVFMRASLGASSITCSYFALKLIPLGDATVIRFSLPIWTLIVGYLALNESCSVLKIGAVFVSIPGVLLIAKPDACLHVVEQLLQVFHAPPPDSALNHTLSLPASSVAELANALADDAPSSVPVANAHQLEGSLLALASSINLALSLIALRLCKRTHAEITILWLSAFSIVIGTCALCGMGEWRLPTNWLDCLYILLNGVCGAIGQWFITSALKIEQSGVISLARTFDIEVAFLYSAFLLKEQITATSIVGSILVSAGVLAVVVPNWLQSRGKKRAAPAVEAEEKK